MQGQESLTQKFDMLNESLTELLGHVRAQSEKMEVIEARVDSNEQKASEKDSVVAGPEDFKQRFGRFIKSEDPSAFLTRCLTDETEDDIVTPWQAVLPPGSREVVAKLVKEKVMPALALGQEAMKAVKGDDVKKAKLQELQASATAMRSILNALLPLIDGISKGGDSSLTEPTNVLTYLLLCEASRQQRSLRNLGRQAIGEEDITYERFKVNADEPDEELYRERKERINLAETLSITFNAQSRKRKRFTQQGYRSDPHPTSRYMSNTSSAGQFSTSGSSSSTNSSSSRGRAGGFGRAGGRGRNSSQRTRA